VSDKRLALLEKLTAEGSKDPFHWYGLALEYQGRSRLEDALATFAKLREIDASYVPQYLMCAKIFGDVGRGDDARAWLAAGIEAARKKGDAHALSELEAALAEAEDG
jgi:tetratricopeptide (TPR) repeat protein